MRNCHDADYCASRACGILKGRAQQFETSAPDESVSPYSLRQIGLGCNRGGSAGTRLEPRRSVSFLGTFLGGQSDGSVAKLGTRLRNARAMPGACDIHRQYRPLRCGNVLKILLAHSFYQRPGGEDQVVAAEEELLRDTGHEVVTYHRRNKEISD